MNSGQFHGRSSAGFTIHRARALSIREYFLVLDRSSGNIVNITENEPQRNSLAGSQPGSTGNKGVGKDQEGPGWKSFDKSRNPWENPVWAPNQSTRIIF